jgi:hypothetical protein
MKHRDALESIRTAARTVSPQTTGENVPGVAVHLEVRHA